MADVKKPMRLARAFRVAKVRVFRRGQLKTADAYDVTRNSASRLTLHIALPDLRSGAPQPREIVIIQAGRSHGAYLVKARVLECRQDEGVELVLEPCGEVKRIQRRDHFRVALQIRARIEHSEDEPVEADTEDVSARGLRIRSPRKMPVGDSVHVTLALAEEGATIQSEGHVRRCRPSEDGQFELGIEFARLRASEEDRLIQALLVAARRGLRL